MITIIRRYFKSGSQILLWVIVAAFIIGLMPLAFRQLTSTSIWAIKVDGQEVGYQEFLLERERQRERIIAFRQQYGEYADWLLSMMGASDPQMLAVQSLTRQELINQFADKLGMHISDDYVVKKMSDPTFIQQELADIIPPQIVDPIKGIDQQMLGRYLKHFGLSIELFERQIERILVDKLVTDMVVSSLYVPEFDVKQKFVAEHAKKTFSLFKFSLDTFIAQQKKAAVLPETLTTFYNEQNKESRRYQVPEKRTGMMWTFDPKTYHIVVTDAQIDEYYENNKLKKYVDKPATVEVRRILFLIPNASQRVAVQEKAARIKDELVRDSSQFIELAKRLSDDKETVQNGGLLKPFTRGSHEQAFDRASFLLQNDGDISDVIETSRGLEIIQRMSKTPQKFKSLASVKQEIKDTLQKQLFERQFIADMRKVIDNEETLTAFIKQKGGAQKELKKIALDETPISQHLFKIKPGERSFFVEGEGGIAVRLDAIKEKYTPALDIIKQTVIDDYYDQQANQELKKTLQEAKEAVGKQSLSALAKTMKADLSETGWLTPGDKDAIESLKKKELPADKMLQMEKVGNVMTHTGPEGGFLIRLDEIEQFDAQKFKEKKEEVAQALEAERTSQYLEGFVASLYRNATIETNESVITLQA